MYRYSLLVVFNLLACNIIAQSIEQQYAKEWCKCADEMFEDYEDDEKYGVHFQKIQQYLLDSISISFSNTGKNFNMKFSINDGFREYMDINKEVSNEFFRAIGETFDICMEDMNEKIGVPSKQRKRKYGKILLKALEVMQNDNSCKIGVVTFAFFINIMEQMK